MVDSKFNSEIVKQKSDVDGAPKVVENPLLAQAAVELSSAPKTYQEKAIQYLESGPGDSRKTLPADKLEAVRAIEKFVVNADSKGLTDYIHGFAGEPAKFEDTMNTVVRDLMSVGIRSSWNYSTRKDRDQPDFSPDSAKEIGNFTVENLNPVGSTTIRFSTEGTPFVHSNETDARNGNVNMIELAHVGLRQSANTWLKRVMD